MGNKKSFLKNLFCKIGIHFWIHWLVKSKLPWKHIADGFDIKTMDELTYRKGRKCDNCGKEQYRVVRGVLSGPEYHNVIS